MSMPSDYDRIAAEIDHKGPSTDPFASAVRATRMPMLISDPHAVDNPIIFVNDAFCNLTGYTREEILGQNCRFLQGAETDQAEVGKLRDAISQRRPIELELMNYKKSGEPFWNRLLVSPVFGVDGALTYFFASQYDVSIERLTEERLRDLNDTLEQRVALASEDRIKAEDQLRQSQKMEAVGQLTGGVAHDFNNLLTVIAGAAEMLSRPDLPEGKRQRYLDAITDTAGRATKLTGQLLAFARRQALKPEVLLVGNNVTAVAGMIATLVGSRVHVEIVAPDEPLYIHVDPSQFDTALVNMAVNARDAMDGEGRLTITIAPTSGIPAVRAHPALQGDYVAVSITDTGTGVAADELDRIFEPFFTTKEVGQGTGLGLSQVFGFAKQSGGEVIARAGAGSGAVFTLYLPRVDPILFKRHDTAEVRAALVGRGARVLVVEDNPDVGQFTTDALNELGHSTILAINARQALDELQRDASRFDVIFSDVVMPGMSGVELGQEVRRLYPDLPIVLASGYSHVLAQDSEHGYELIHKPYSMDELSRVLRKVCEHRVERIPDLRPT